MSRLQPEPPEDGLVENQGVDAGELPDEPRQEEPDAPSRDAVRAGGHAEQAGDGVHRAAVGTGYDDDPGLPGAPEPSAEDSDAGGQDSGSIA